jgi:GH24 family phage-related lysozyme (muramidase)
MHFYCVWDFMNLVKRLQMDMTCSKLPFKPAKHKAEENIRRFVNEIILEEESDEIGDNFTSHFTYYKMAFTDIETDATLTGAYDHVLKFHEVMMHEDLSYQKVIKLTSIPKPAQAFLASTEKQASNPNVLHAAASFTFGREDVLPSIFMALINQPFIKGQFFL